MAPLDFFSPSTEVQISHKIFFFRITVVDEAEINKFMLAQGVKLNIIHPSTFRYFLRQASCRMDKPESVPAHGKGVGRWLEGPFQFCGSMIYIGLAAFCNKIFESEFAENLKGNLS